MPPVVSITNLSKTYSTGFQALKNINLDVGRGEFLALLGPNGAGKSTLISIICGIVRPSEGTVAVGGYDTVKDFRAARAKIGLVPQELATDAFERVWSAVSFSRGLFGKRADSEYLARVLKDLSLWDRRNSPIMTLSGGMKRRLMIAKALAHEPEILFLDEPSAGVDVDLRKDMWDIARKLQASGVTIILTTHYLEEAEHLADRVCIINRGEILVAEKKVTLMSKLGKKLLKLHLHAKLDAIPSFLNPYSLALSEDGRDLVFAYDRQSEHTGIPELLRDLNATGITFSDLSTHQSSLEDIFIDLVRR